MSIFRNPYQYTGVVLARLCINVTTLIWSCIVIAHPMIVGTLAGYEFLWGIMPPLYFGIFGSVLAVVCIVRLIVPRKPHWLGSVGYGLQMLFWTYLAISGWIVPVILRPGATAAITCVAALSVYAFVSNSRHAKLS
jgi:hypothetical protein